jgi:hypothetical protein
MSETHRAVTAASEAPRARPTGFRIPTPGNWFDLDLDPRTRNQSIADLVDSRIATTPEIAERRQELVRLLRRVAREAAEGGAIFASMVSEIVTGTGMSASVLVVVRAVTADGPAEAPLTDPASLAGAVAAGRETGDGARDQPDVGVVELGCGRAVRVAGRREHELPGTSQSLLTWEVQYFIPVPSTELIMVVTFSTPALSFAEPFTGLFDTMAERLEFTYSPATR